LKEEITDKRRGEVGHEEILGKGRGGNIKRKKKEKEEEKEGKG
jgi:hypothetical protein